ncbi:MAG: hypothetical protein ACYTDY_03520 [Planctomycetota bacterium]
MRKPAAILLATALALLASGDPVRSAEEIRIDDLRLGTDWYGAKVTHEDLVGKVVLVELWGS